jgi:hypothetical protein
MSDGPEWFAPKRYGYGSGAPLTWQGWAMMIGYMVAIFAAAFTFRARPIQLFAVAIPLTVVFMVVCARTTRGGWRWRWGDDD